MELVTRQPPGERSRSTPSPAIPLLLPEAVDQGQIFEIQVPSKVRRGEGVKLLEVCWIRLIPITECVNMYLVGTRFLFDLPVFS